MDSVGKASVDGSRKGNATHPPTSRGVFTIVTFYSWCNAKRRRTNCAELFVEASEKLSPRILGINPGKSNSTQFISCHKRSARTPSFTQYHPHDACKHPPSLPLLAVLPLRAVVLSPAPLHHRISRRNRTSHNRHGPSSRASSTNIISLLLTTIGATAQSSPFASR